MYKMISYPLAHPPQSVIIEAALYWDGLISLIPGGWRPQVNSPGNALNAMLDRGLYESVILEDCLDGAQLFKLAAELGEALGVAGSRPLIPLDLDLYSRVWAGKLPHVIEQAALERGWIVEDENLKGAFRGDPALLQGLIALLANQAAEDLRVAHEGVSYVPSTTSEFAHRCATAPIPSQEGVTSWMLNISRYLPIPALDTPLDKILKFRLKYDDERSQCLDAVRELQARLSQTIGDPTEMLIEMNRKLNPARESLNKAASSWFSDLRSTSIYALITTGVTAAGSIVGNLAGSDYLQVAAPAAAAGLLVFSHSPVLTTTRRHSEYNYVHQLDRTFGVSPR